MEVGNFHLVMITKYDVTSRSQESSLAEPLPSSSQPRLVHVLSAFQSSDIITKPLHYRNFLAISHHGKPLPFNDAILAAPPNATPT